MHTFENKFNKQDYALDIHQFHFIYHRKSGLKMRKTHLNWHI